MIQFKSIQFIALNFPGFLQKVCWRLVLCAFSSSIWFISSIFTFPSAFTNNSHINPQKWRFGGPKEKFDNFLTAFLAPSVNIGSFMAFLVNYLLSLYLSVPLSFMQAIDQKYFSFKTAYIFENLFLHKRISKLIIWKIYSTIFFITYFLDLLSKNFMCLGLFIQ